MIGSDDELLTDDTELPSDSYILAEFQPDDSEIEEEDEVLIELSRPRNVPQNMTCAMPLMCCRHSVYLSRLKRLHSKLTLESLQESSIAIDSSRSIRAY